MPIRVSTPTTAAGFQVFDHRRAKVGVTIHEIDDQLDYGPIIAQRECAIEPD